MTREAIGIIPPLTTPFDEDGNVYEEGLRRLVDFQIEKGVHGLFICGTYGSGPIMTVAQRQQVAEIVVDQALPGTTTLRNNYIYGPCPLAAQGHVTSQGGNVGSDHFSDQRCGLSDPTDQIVPGDPLVLPLG